MTAASAVLPATFVDIIQDLEVRLLGSPVISIRGSDLWALNLLYFGKNPLTLAPGAATNNRVRVYGLDVPLQQAARPPGALAIQVGRVGVSGVDSETITIAELSSDVALAPKYYHYVTIPLTLAATTGYGNFVDLPQPGDLHGILFYNSTIPTKTSDTASVQKVMVVIDGARAYEASFHEMKADSIPGSGHDTGDSPADTSFIDNYCLLDLRKDPVPAASTVKLDINAGVASDTVRIIPIYLV